MPFHTFVYACEWLALLEFNLVIFYNLPTRQVKCECSDANNGDIPYSRKIRNDGITALPSVKYGGRVEINYDLGEVRREYFMSQPIARTTNGLPMLLEKLRKNN